MGLREYRGGAAAQTLGTSLALATTTTFTLAADPGSSWPSGGANGDFVVAIDRGTASEEKILCSARSGATCTIAGSGRGFDGTTAANHSAGAVVEHVVSAEEIDDLNDHVYDTSRDDHTNYLNAARHNDTTLHTVGGEISAASAGDIARMAAGASASAGSNGKAPHGDHRHQEPLIPYVEIKRSVLQAIPTATVTWVSFNTEVADTDTLWSAGTTVTIVKSGIYLVIGLIPWDDPAASIERSAILEWNAGYGSGNHHSVTMECDGTLRQKVSATRRFSAADTIRLGVLHNRGSDLNIAGTGGEDVPTLTLCRIGAFT